MKSRLLHFSAALGPHARLVFLLLAVCLLCTACGQEEAPPPRPESQTPEQASGQMPEQTPGQIPEQAPPPAPSVYCIMKGRKAGTLESPPSGIGEEGLQDLRSKGFHLYLRDPNPSMRRYFPLKLYHLHEGVIYSLDIGATSYRVSDKGHFVTTSSLGLKNDEKAFLAAGSTGSYAFFPVEALWKSSDKQLALLQVPALAAGPVLPFADPQGIAPGDKATAMGFIAIHDPELMGRGSLDDDAFLKPRIVPADIVGTKTRPNGTKIWEIFSGVTPGMEGAPLLNACGQVSGTVAVIADFTAGVAQPVIALEELLPDLDRLGVPHVKAEGPCTPEPAVTTTITNIVEEADLEWAKYVLGAFAAMFALLGAYLIRLRLRVRQGYVPQINSRLIRGMLGIPSQAYPDAPRQDPAWKKDINGKLYRFDPVEGVIYKDADKEGAGKAASGRLALLRSATALPDIVLEEGKALVIGSSPRKAQFLIEDKRVSAAHVKLAYSDGVVSAQDLGSTNGSYVNGKKISGKTLLTSGDTLRLTAKKGVAEYTLAVAAKTRTNEKAAAPAGGSADEAVSALAIVPLFAGAGPLRLEAGLDALIGRDPCCALVINDAIVSKKHCRVSFVGGGLLELRDLESSNGTFAAGVGGRVSAARLGPGELFYVADEKYSFRVEQWSG